MGHLHFVPPKLTSNKSSCATNVNARARGPRRAYFVIFAFVVLAALITQGAIHFSNKKKSPAASKSKSTLPEEMSGWYDHALEQWRLLPRANALESAPVGSIAGTVWKPIGPSPIVEEGCCVDPKITFAANGRVNSIAVDPTDTNVLYLGSAGGGVWKSVDRGDHWRPTTDQEISLGIGSSHALAIDPNHPNTIYAGTSSYGMLDQSLPRPIDSAQSRGILKSTDAGASWIRLGSGIPTGNSGNAVETFRGRNINTIIVDPADSNVLYLGAGRGGDPNFGGVFRSTDGGLSWTQATGTSDTWVESLVLDMASPVSSRVLYAGAFGQGVLKSTDGGQSFTPVLAPHGTLKTMVALAPVASPANPAGPVIYASIQLIGTPRNLGIAIFESTNGGQVGTWTQKAATVIISDDDYTHLEGDGFSDMVVDPASPGDGVNDHIYWGGLTQYLSTDSGSTFNEIGQLHGIHGDHQTWLVVPHAGTNTVYAGDDGGIWRSEDQGASWTGTSLTSLASTINSGGLQIATFYNLTIKQDATATVTIAGAQDSGILRSPAAPPAPPLPSGSQPWSGTSDDGIDVAFNKVTTDVAYAIRNASFQKSADSGATWPIDFTATLPSAQVGIFRNRYAVDPNNSSVLYVGGSGIFPNPSTPADVLQSQDGASSFRALGLTAPAFITSLDVARGDSNHLVVAAGTHVYITVNALASDVGPPSGVVFTEVTENLPSRFVTRVAFDPNDPNVIYATLAGFETGHVFRKSLTQPNWTDISPALDIPVNAIALDGGSNPAMLYVGTDLGVLRRSVASGATWEVVDDLHLPNAAVSDLEINTQAGVLRVATWGRGVFELAAPVGTAISVAEQRLSFDATCAVIGGNRTIHVSNVGTANLIVSSVQRIAGSSSFTILSNPATPLSIASGGSATFTVHYTPTVPATPESAIIRITTNDPAVPFVDLVATGRLENSPPNITSLAATPAFLLPTNHKMVPVTISVAVTDNCDTSVLQSCHITSVTSNEPVSGTGEGDTEPDWQITGNLTLNLRAERAGSGNGRIYTINVRCVDNAGNGASRSTTVTAPHN